MSEDEELREAPSWGKRGKEGLGTPSKKKLADLRTLSQLSLTLPPLGPIRTNFNWDIF